MSEEERVTNEEENVTSEEEIPKPPLSGIVYGELIYWIVLAGTAVVILGSVLAFITESNFADVSYWISSIWDGKETSEIWEGTSRGSLPRNHWYLSHLTTGDGLTAFGISLGVFSVIMALFGTSIVLYRGQNKLYGSLAVIAALIVIIAMLQLIPLPVE